MNTHIYIAPIKLYSRSKNGYNLDADRPYITSARLRGLQPPVQFTSYRSNNFGSAVLGKLLSKT